MDKQSRFADNLTEFQIVEAASQEFNDQDVENHSIEDDQPLIEIRIVE